MYVLYKGAAVIMKSIYLVIIGCSIVGIVTFAGCGKKPVMKKPSMKIVFFGDSITYGHGVNNDRESFYARIDYVMKAGVYGDVTTVNAGVSGDDTSEALERVREVVTYEPDILVIAFGLNDCQTQSVDLAIFRKNLIKIISFFPRNTRIVLATSNTFMDTGQPLWKDLNSSLELYMNEIRTLAGERKYPLIDVHSVWKDHIRQDSRHRESMYVDPTHPSAKGHELIFETYMNVLRKIIME